MDSLRTKSIESLYGHIRGYINKRKSEEYWDSGAIKRGAKGKYEIKIDADKAWLAYEQQKKYDVMSFSSCVQYLKGWCIFNDSPAMSITGNNGPVLIAAQTPDIAYDKIMQIKNGTLNYGYTSAKDIDDIFNLEDEYYHTKYATPGGTRKRYRDQGI